MGIFGKIFGDANLKAVEQLKPLVEQINELEPRFQGLSDQELAGKTLQLRERLDQGAELDEFLPEAFALAREAAKRTLKQRHFDVQMLGGIVLHHGQIAEMRTGEGKTLVATLPAYLNGLKHQVHIVTVNDYLARRDTAWMGQIYHFLGLSVACLNNDGSYLYDPSHIRVDRENGISNFQFPISKQVPNSNDQNSKQNKLDVVRDTQGAFRVVHEFLRPCTKQEAYQADIVYGTNSEFGFDYLRDNLAYGLGQVVQKGHHFAIVDEVDSILIDEARTPLIISAPDVEAAGLYKTFSQVAKGLKPETHYTVDEKRRSAILTEEGISAVEQMLNKPGIYESGNVRLAHHLEQALKAQVIYKRDKDYVVKNGQVIIVDEFTGRLLHGRRYSEGLHQAIEAKEGVEVQKESRTMATITFQNYFRMYEKLAGMTGTAQTNAEEFHKVYKLEVVTIPTNKLMIRKDEPDIIYKTEEAKWRALVGEIKDRHAKGQPVLCGTTSIQRNEKLSAMLKVEGILHQMLNAKNHEAEGQVIAQAGRFKAVTIATNMAGRGVDIILGGNPPDQRQAESVKGVGGLHVIGTERHEARRIDNQLRGRAGRQGDSGSSQFFISLEDDVIRIFGGDRIKSLMERLGLPDDMPIQSGLVSKAIEQAQSKIESHNFDIRKYVLEFDDVMNKQRSFVYRKRQQILRDAQENPEKLRSEILEMVESQVRQMVEAHIVAGTEEEIDKILQFWTGQPLQRVALQEQSHPLQERIFENLLEMYNVKEKELGQQTMRQLEKALLLQVVDMLWLEHIEHMEHLRDSVGLRAYGQQDPLVEYKKEGLKLFKQLQEAIPAFVVANIFKVGQPQKPATVQFESKKPIQASASDSQGKKLGRNDPCWCGSGKKFKRCGILNTEEHKKLMSKKQI